jgi:hypothetical protein
VPSDSFQIGGTKPQLAAAHRTSRMSVMLQTPSRASTASSSSFQPVSRQNTMSSHDGSRSARQSKRYSVTALYLSMSANEKDLEIEDELARGMVLIGFTRPDVDY